MGDDCSETFTDAENPPTWDAQERLLTVFLPKADEVKVRYSTYPAKELNGAGGLDLLGLWSWLRGSSLADKLEFLAQQGVHWMISPYREITLVHAVQQPLCAPKIQALSAPRGLNKTYTNLTGDFELSVKSTAKLDMDARWDDRVDDMTELSGKTSRGVPTPLSGAWSSNSPTSSKPPSRTTCATSSATRATGGCATA